MRREDVPDRAEVLERMRRLGWEGDARGIEEGRYTYAQVAEAFEALTRSGTEETRALARDLRLLAEHGDVTA